MQTVVRLAELQVLIDRATGANAASGLGGLGDFASGTEKNTLQLGFHEGWTLRTNA